MTAPLAISETIRTSRPSPRVLLVDDDPVERRALERCLRRAGYQVDRAEDGQAAMALLMEERHSVVITDLDMPRMCGSALMQAALQELPDTTFVVVTGTSTPSLPPGASSRRIASVIGKPWNEGALVAALERGLQLSEEHRGPTSAPASGNLLLLEDDENDAELATRTLSKHLPGWSATRAKSLEEALEKLALGNFTVVLSDLSLPDADGIDAVLRLQTVAREVPVIILSGAADESVALEAVKAGAQDFLLKDRLDGRSLVRSIYYSLERKRAELELERRANFDELTGLANRNQFHVLLDKSVARSRRSGRGFAVFYLDLDGFKAVNDALGHAAGDALLVEAAQRLLATARECDIVARLGGDEFAMVLDNLPSPAHATRAAQRLLDALSRPYGTSEVERKISASLGIAFYPDGGESSQQLVKAADAAMYEAKAQGRNNYQFWQHKGLLSGRSQLVTELRGALARKEFLLHYQPQLDKQGGIHSAEALLRWHRPGSGALLPASFLPQLEASLDIVEVGAWVIRAACAQLQLWLGKTTIARISVNISARQLEGNSLIHVVQAALEESGIPPSSLELELTESAVMRRPEHSIGVLAELAELGVRIAIDDFGCGYSSFAYLYRLPVHVVKLDRSFTQDVSQNRRCRAITRSIVALGRELELDVIAEGVETEEQRSILWDAGCDLLQGYLIGRPKPSGQFMLDTKRSCIDSHDLTKKGSKGE